MSKLLSGSSLFLFLLMQACQTGLRTEDGTDTTLRFTPDDGYIYIQKVIWDPYCVGCHAPGNEQGDLDMSDGNGYRAMVNVNAVIDSSVLLIRPLSKESSYVYQTLIDSNNAPVMPPPPLALLSADMIRIVGDWIDSGAENGN